MSNAETSVLDRVGAVSLRMMAGQVPSRTIQRLQALVQSNPDAYPWEEVTDEILAAESDEARLVQSALRAQRDWVLRGGRTKPKKSVKSAGKRFLAFVLARSIFFALYSIAAVVLLLLLKHHWPQIDIYRVLDWLRDLLPGVFGSSGG